MILGVVAAAAGGGPAVDYGIENMAYSSLKYNFIPEITTNIHLNYSGPGKSLVVGNTTGYVQYSYKQLDETDITTLSLQDNSFALSGTAQSAFWDRDGTAMLYISNGANVRSRDASIPFDLTTLGTPILRDLSGAGDGSVVETRALSVKGDHVYIIDQGTDEVKQYERQNAAGVAWAEDLDFVTAKSIVISGGTNYQGVDFSPDGKTMLILNTGTDFVDEWALGTPYMVATATYVRSVSANTVGESVTYNNISYNKNASSVILSAGNTEVAYQFNLSNNAPPSPSYLLDDYDYVKAAYSFRKLKSTATFAARLVRVSDSASTDLYLEDTGFVSTSTPVTAGGTLGAWAGSSDVKIKIWFDQTGNGWDAIGEDGQLPKFMTAGVIETANGQPAVLSVVSQNKGLYTVGHVIDLENNDLTAIAVGRYNSTAGRYIVTEPDNIGTYSSSWILGGAGTGSTWINGTTQGNVVTVRDHITTMTYTHIGDNYKTYDDSKLFGPALGVSLLPTVGAGTGLLHPETGVASSSAHAGAVNEILLSTLNLEYVLPVLHNNMNAEYGVYTQTPSAPTISQNSAPQETSVSVARTDSSGGTGALTYQWFLDGALYSTTTTDPLTISGLTADTSYTVTCKALDEAGVTSSVSNSYNFTTAGGLTSISLTPFPSGSSLAACSETVTGQYWSDGSGDVQIGDTIYTDSGGTTPLNGGSQWRKAPFDGNAAVQITSGGLITSKAAC